MCTMKRRMSKKYHFQVQSRYGGDDFVFDMIHSTTHCHESVLSLKNLNLKIDHEVYDSSSTLSV